MSWKTAATLCFVAPFAAVWLAFVVAEVRYAIAEAKGGLHRDRG